MGKRGGGNGGGAPRLEEADPDRFQIIKAELEAGKTVRELIEAHDVSVGTLARIRKDYPANMPAPPTKRLEDRDPEKFDRICQALTAQVPVNIISSELGVGTTTVARIKREYAGQHPEWRQAASASLAWNAMLLAESIRKDVLEDNLAPSAKAFALSVSAQNAQLLAGQATSISATQNSPAIKQVNSALDALEILDAEVVEDEPKKD